MRDPPPDLSLRLALLTVVLVAFVEALYRALVSGALDPAALGPLASHVLGALEAYWRARAWTLAHPWTVALGASTALGVVLVAFRQSVIF